MSKFMVLVVMNLYLVKRYILFKYAISKNHKDTLKID